MSGPTMPPCMDYVLRLAERIDGWATHIDGTYVAATKPRAGEGGPQVTRDAGAAMRFHDADAASRFLAGSLARGLSEMDSSLSRLIHTYVIDVVGVGRPG